MDFVPGKLVCRTHARIECRWIFRHPRSGYTSA
nr:MAG TPA: hypothetical protein [Bacteriophage sp.]DAX07213.1 MAG TPA: hypothetical protein [Bacteriophage sp.]DAZ43540.1 MAG TPA: hypothetical protein [Caudoviricetes sp.]